MANEFCPTCGQPLTVEADTERWCAKCEPVAEIDWFAEAQKIVRKVEEKCQKTV